ncbi:MAG TPA: hypothetical protein VKI00_19600 [Mycobacterium sp.]|nr:hypothetical protein [Mycobacterium sp.]
MTSAFGLLLGPVGVSAMGAPLPDSSSRRSPRCSWRSASSSPPLLRQLRSHRLRRR